MSVRGNGHRAFREQAMYHDSPYRLLEAKRASILRKWLQLIIDAYPADTAKFLQNEKDRFANPVGCAISEQCGAIFGELLGDMDTEKLLTSLDEIISVRTVQEFSPSDAVGFVFSLKQAIRQELAAEIEGDRVPAELCHIESRIDRVALLAFDTYMKYRERISQIRMREIAGQREMALMMLARANAEDELGESV